MIGIQNCRVNGIKAFWARGYYVSTIGNITEEAIKKYIREQAEESRKEDLRKVPLYSGPVTMHDTRPFGASKIPPIRVDSNHHSEMVVMM